MRFMRAMLKRGYATNAFFARLERDLAFSDRW